MILYKRRFVIENVIEIVYRAFQWISNYGSTSATTKKYNIENSSFSQLQKLNFVWKTYIFPRPHFPGKFICCGII